MLFHMPPAAAQSALSLILAFCCMLRFAAWADPVIPGNVLDPKTPAEAWNVIRLATANVDKLIAEKRLNEIPVQVSWCSPALRTLARSIDNAEAIAKAEPDIKRAQAWLSAIATSANASNEAVTTDGLAKLRTLLEIIGKYFDPQIVRADIYFCPMHPDFIAEKLGTPCNKCGMDLLTRRIPYSFIYTKPGEPSIRMSATASAPIEAGKKVDVAVRLQKADGSPVLYSDLMEMHTEPIHLLIEEPGLGDYHHEHPVASDTPGEYTFSFTPKKTAPYRIWADIVPVANGVQELPHIDLPSASTGEPVSDTANRFTTTVKGYHFTLALSNGNNIATKAEQTRGMTISITDADGNPVKNLAPVMNAFAHLVGFYGDYQTVVHLHPTGGDILNQDLRGGPSLGFKFFAPKAGFIRLYCQVLIDGEMLFAPFNLNVEP